MLRQLRLHPLMQPFHQRPAVLLMEVQPVFRRQFPFPRHCIVVINAAQRLQHITAFFRKVDRPPPPPAVFHARGSSRSGFRRLFGVLRDSASHIWIGAGSSCARCFRTSARFSPACFHPVKNSAMVHAPTSDTMPLVKVPVRLSPGSRINRRIRMLVSSLCITRPCAACRINSSSASRISSRRPP